MAAVTVQNDLEPKKIKSANVTIVSPSISHEVMGPDAMILVLNIEFCQLFLFHLHQEAV